MNPSRTRNHLAADLDHLERASARSRMILGPRDRVPAGTKREMERAAQELEALTQTWGNGKGDRHGME